MASPVVVVGQPRQRGWLRPSAALAPGRARVNLYAALAITAAIAALGVLTRAGWLPWIRPGGPPISLQAELFIEPPVIVVWFIFVQIAALALPAILCMLGGWRDPRIRMALLPYLVILASHILSEALFRQVFFTNISLFLGLLYSPYRSWQAWYLGEELGMARELGARQRFAAQVLRAESIIWAINLLVLIVFKLPRCIGVA